jgi:hypothetical protein
MRVVIAHSCQGMELRRCPFTCIASSPNADWYSSISSCVHAM